MVEREKPKGRGQDPEADESELFNAGYHEPEGPEPEPPVSLPMPTRRVPMTTAGVEREVAQMEKSIDLFNRLKGLSLKLTKPEDWIDQDGSPYLMDRGAENLAIAWGIDVFGLKVQGPIWEEDESGRYFMFIASGTATSRRLGRSLEDQGTCSQRDKLFGMRGGKLKEIHEVDMMMVRKKAITNLYNRLIKRATGLLNVTFDDLKSAGLEVSKITKIEYDKGRQKAEDSLSPELKARREEIRKMCLEIANGKDLEAKKVLEEMSAFKGTDGIVKASNVNKLRSERWINTTHTRVKEAYEKIMAAAKAAKPLETRSEPGEAKK